jgi:hypothetical protein
MTGETVDVRENHMHVAEPIVREQGGDVVPYPLPRARRAPHPLEIGPIRASMLLRGMPTKRAHRLAKLIIVFMN